MGLKLIVVCGLALLMTIPSLFVDSLVDERAHRATDVDGEISARAGGQQVLLGPTLAIPYRAPSPYQGGATAYGTYVVFPTQGDANVKVHTEQRRRSLFRVPVYQAALKFDATFDLTSTPLAPPVNAELDWSRASIVIGISDARGALADGTLTVNGNTRVFTPAENIAGDSPHLVLSYFAVDISDLARPNAKFSTSVNLSISGAHRLSILPYGKSTHISAQGDWPSPGFDGTFVPLKRATSDQGFSADWAIPYIARGVAAEGTSPVLGVFDRTAPGISFVEMADPYQSISRSLKYALLFVGLLFLSYFVFEVTSGKRVHPAQYILVGIAHMIFYLLLLSVAERIGFDWAFLLAGAATVLLLSANAGWIFASRIQGFRAFVVFALLYFFMYLLLRLEDNALLVGAVASFLGVAAVMYFTRNLDWYSSMTNHGPEPSQSAGND